MRKNVLLFALILLFAQCVSAQDSTGSETRYSQYLAGKNNLFRPKSLIGFRAGVNFSDMVYSDPQLDWYDHKSRIQGLLGLYGQFQLGSSNFSIRPEVDAVNRSVSLSVYDVGYKMNIHYVDFRLPISYNFRFLNAGVSPYLMAAPLLSVAYGGNIHYHDDYYTEGIEQELSKANAQSLDYGILLAGGIEWYSFIGKLPVLFSIEAGYSMGFNNIFSSRERLDNTEVPANGYANIANAYPGVELYRESRCNRGIEVVLRAAIPLGNSWKRPAEYYARYNVNQLVPDSNIIRETDTVWRHMTDTIWQTNEVKYVHKDCYSFSDISALVEQGEDVSNKRICLFNINFKFNSASLSEAKQDELNDVAKLLDKYPDIRIRVIGHTDSIGSDEYNQTLSEQRADAVVQYLHSRGVEIDRMFSIGCGEKFPYSENSTPEGRYRNRRVEIDIFPNYKNLNR